MLHYRLTAALAIAVLSPVAALAQDAAPAAAPVEVRPGNLLRTADGKRAGAIFSLDKAADGSVAGVALIGPNSTLVHVPIATITAVDKTHFTTSMTYKEVFR